jgi:hypothetical protein
MKSLTVKLCIFLSFILVVNKTHAQTPDTNTTEKLLQYIFQPIDKSQVPTGFLEEYRLYCNKRVGNYHFCGYS